MGYGPEQLSLGILDIVERLYTVDKPREQWASEVLDAASSALSLGRGVALSLYTAPTQDAVHLDHVNTRNVPDELRQTGINNHQSPAFSGVLSRFYHSRMLSNWRDLALEGEHAAHGGENAFPHKWIVNGINPSGMGCAIWTFSKDEHALSDGERRLLKKLALHLATSYRLWNRHAGLDPLSAAPVEAILSPSGKIEHAELSAQPKDARAALLESSKLRDWARSHARRHEPERAVSAWRGLSAARWSFVDAVEHDGKRYVLARENLPDHTAHHALSTRELQVVALARIGRSNKVIAYELGLSASTVRVLMARASRKLGVRTRSELIQRLDDPAAASGHTRRPR